MAIIAEVNTPALVAAHYHRADLSEVRLVDGKAHVRVLSYRDKQARLSGAEHLARQMLTIDFDMKSTVPAIEQIYAGIKAALGHEARDDIDEVGAYLRENAQATSAALRAAALASSHAAQQEREVQSSQPSPTETEHAFADLMLADETTDDARARLSQRLRELRHYLIAPEIRVNEDGSLGLTAGEQAELQDLERRQTLGRWLEA